MSKKHYENVAIINAALEDEQIEQTISIIQESIKNYGGEITDLERWGRKRLAYSINKAKSGYYLITRFTASTEMISQFERSLRLDENVLRFLTVALDKIDLEHIKHMESEENAETEDTKADSVQEKASNNESKD
jgi:small subunit ribosomal protein S6